MKAPLLSFIDAKNLISKEELEVNYKEYSSIELRKLYNISHSTLYDLLKYYEIPLKRKVKASPKRKKIYNVDISKEDLYQLYIVQNLSLDDLVLKLSIPRGVIFKKIQEYNIKKPMELQLKAKEHTNLERRGVKYNMQDPLVKEKVKETNLKTRGCEWILSDPNVRKIITEKMNNRTKEETENITKKIKQTKLDRYGDENYNNQEKCDKTHYERYGSKRATHLPEVQAKMKATNLERRGYENAAQDPEVRKKMIQTSIANGTCGNQISKWEQSLVDRIREVFPEYTIVQQYKEERYPYLCDCYIKELDLFIEFNGSFYHNYRPFVESIEMIEEYDDMVARSELLESIANKWRYIDPEKRRIAEMNNLNFIEYWEDSTEDIVELIERYTHKNL